MSASDEANSTFSVSFFFQSFFFFLFLSALSFYLPFFFTLSFFSPSYFFFFETNFPSIFFFFSTDFQSPLQNISFTILTFNVFVVNKKIYFSPIVLDKHKFAMKRVTKEDVSLISPPYSSPPTPPFLSFFFSFIHRR